MNMLLLLLSQALLVSAAAQNVGARHLLDQQPDGGFGKRVISGAGATFPCACFILYRWRSCSMLHALKTCPAQELADAHMHALASALLRSNAQAFGSRTGWLQMGRVPKVDGGSVVQEA
jgi:hypothetical protein